MVNRVSSSSLVSIPKEVRTALSLSSTSDAENSVRLCVGSKRVKSKFLYQDADVVTLADKCLVIRNFVCRNYDKFSWRVKFSDIRVTENGLVSGVDRVFKSCQILRFKASAIDSIHSVKLLISTSSFLSYRLVYSPHASMERKIKLCGTLFYGRKNGSVCKWF